MLWKKCKKLATIALNHMNFSTHSLSERALLCPMRYLPPELYLFAGCFQKSLFAEVKLYTQLSDQILIDIRQDKRTGPLVSVMY